jgi:hypothetical protein
LKRWEVLNLSTMTQQKLEAFVDSLYNDGKARGLTIDFPIYQNTPERDFERGFEALVQASKKKFGKIYKKKNFCRFSKIRHAFTNPRNL